MVATPEIQISQGRILAAVRQLTEEIQVTQSRLMAAINFPTPEMQVSQARIHVSVNATKPMYVSQGRILAAVRGRVANPRVRAWTYTLDGHDFYVLRLGDTETLVFDVNTQQWVNFRSPELDFWRVNTGMTWVGGQQKAYEYGSNIVVGDDTHGLLWFLDPEQPHDEHPDPENPTQQLYFDRIVMGQVAIRGREVLPCYAAWLTTDMGQPAYTGAGVTLSISDDAGKSFVDMGTVNVTMDAFSPETSWYSLGQIGAPGRLFKITDDGAVARIDGMEMNDPDDAG